MRPISVLWIVICFEAVSFAQQVPDTAFSPLIPSPAYEEGQGPMVQIDAAHHNFHTVDGRYLPFANLLRRDGYRVKGLEAPFSHWTLEEGRVLVIANALSAENDATDTTSRGWTLPNPSAFTKEEIEAVRTWVHDVGGSLLLIADHMPFPGCNLELAEAFGIRLTNGFAIDTNDETNFTFSKSNRGLGKHAITDGIDSVRSFTGEAIQPDTGLIPLMTLKPGTVLLLPVTAWEFSEKTQQLDVSGWYQGAVKQYGKGRVAVFGEAAMFTAQLGGPNKNRVGMNSPDAPQNAHFLLNVMHWLTGVTN